MAEQRWQCDNCNWIGTQAEFLTAPNPFDTDLSILGCPACKDVGDFIALCDEAGCNAPVTCGWPSPGGYRHTCGAHSQDTFVGRLRVVIEAKKNEKTDTGIDSARTRHG